MARESESPLPHICCLFPPSGWRWPPSPRTSAQEPLQLEAGELLGAPPFPSPSLDWGLFYREGADARTLSRGSEHDRGRQPAWG